MAILNIGLLKRHGPGMPRRYWTHGRCQLDIGSGTAPRHSPLTTSHACPGGSPAEKHDVIRIHLNMSYLMMEMSYIP